MGKHSCISTSTGPAHPPELGRPSASCSVKREEKEESKPAPSFATHLFSCARYVKATPSLPSPPPPSLPPPPPPSQNSKYVHLHQFFAFYPEYRYNETKPVMEEFYSMSKKVGLKPDEEAEAVRDLQEAVAKTFNMLYGTEIDDFSAWEKMYRALYPNPDPVDLSDLDICRYVSWHSKPESSLLLVPFSRSSVFVYRESRRRSLISTTSSTRVAQAKPSFPSAIETSWTNTLIRPSSSSAPIHSPSVTFSDTSSVT